MSGSIYILFICITLPLIMTTFFIDRKAKIFVIYMCIGCCACLLSGEINTVVVRLLQDRDTFYITTNITPITEELLKALPILAFALFISDNKSTLINISMVTGIGFAILENTHILMNAGEATVMWALIRGLGAGFMHGLSTLIVGYGLSYIKKRQAFLYPGVFGLLTTAIIFHGAYNTLVQSEYSRLGYFLPVVTFAVLKIIFYYLDKNREAVASS